MLLETKKGSYLLDVERTSRRDSLTRINSLIPLKDKQNIVAASTLNSQILYSESKKGIINVV